MTKTKKETLTEDVVIDTNSLSEKELTLEIAVQCLAALIKSGKIPNKEGTSKTAWEHAESFIEYGKKTGRL